MSQYSYGRSTNSNQNRPQDLSQSQSRRAHQQTTPQRNQRDFGRDYESQAINEAVLAWSSLGEGRDEVVIQGESDIHVLRNLKNVLLALQTQYLDGGSKIVISGDRKSQFDKRLLLLESEIEGLLKRRINYSARDEMGGTRVMDYTGLLNEKQTQVVELEKKINNLQQRLRRRNEREVELENHIAHLYAELKKKQEIIIAKNQVILAEVAASNQLVEALRKANVNIPNVGSFDIKADALTRDGSAPRSKIYQDLPQAQKYRTQLVALFRQFERLSNQQGGIIDGAIEKVLQGFLVGLQGTRIKESVELSIQRRQMEDDYSRLKDQFGVAVGIFQDQVERLKREGGSFRLDMDPKIFEILKDQRIQVFKTSNDIVHLERFSQRTVQVPVQDARTKHLMHLLAVNMKKLTMKYPKLYEEMDKRLTEFFQQELIDIIEVDELDRVVQIVKYEPQVVKVENVYAYSSEKSRKVEFHLRVLIKALLEELEKLKRRTGAVLEIDEGIIGMINQEIMGVVDVDDILKVFRVVPKIVEVEKIVEKVVDRIVEVPQVVPVQKIIQKIVEVEKVREVQKIVNVPLEVPTIITNIVEKVIPVQKIIEKVVEVPQVVERIVQVIKQVPKIVEIQRIEERPVQVQKVIEVESVRNHVQTQIRQVQVIVQKVVTTEKIVKQVVEVPVIVQKIVEKIVQVPKIVEVEKIVEKAVPIVQYKNAKEVENHIQIRHQVVDRIVERPIPIIQTVEKIVEVPQIVEKIISVENVIREPYEVEIIHEKIVIQDRIKEVEVIVEKPVQVIKQVIKQIERIVQIPVVHQRIVSVQQIVEKPVVQRIENTIIKEVFLRDPIIVHEPKTIEVERIVNHYIDVPKPVKYIQEKIVQVVKHVDRIKEIKVPVEKVIEKMVEVPKVVEVEKIVEKVVVVPRVVEKVVQVPQIVQRVVPKVVVEQKIIEVQRVVQVPVIQDKVVEVQVQKNIYIEVEKIVQKIVDKLIEVPKYEEKIINNQVIVEKVIEVIKQVPRDMEVQKIVYNTVEVPHFVDVERQIVVPVEVPIPVQKIVEKLVPIEETIEKIVQVPQVVEKIVDRKVESVETQEIVKIQQKIVIDTKVKQVVNEVPYYQEKVVEVPTIVQKIVPVENVVQEVITAQQIVEKVVQKSTIVPKVYEVERIQEKVVEVPKILQVEKIIPQLVNVNRYIQNIVEKIVEVPVIVEQVKEVVRENEKIVEVRNDYETVKQVESIVQKAVVVEKFKEVVRNINHIEKVLQIVDRYEQTPVEILVQEEKLVEVPYILEKIVEKIVVMPQIVEVLKYVHEVTEKEELGVAVGVDVATHEQRLKILTKDLKVNFDVLLVELRKLKANPALKGQIELIEKFLVELQQFILYPKIFQVPKETIVEKVVQKDKVVTLPTQDQRSLRMQLTLSLLVEKLIVQLKRIQKDNPNVKLQLEDDVRLIFFEELGGNANISAELNAKMKSFSDSVYRKFESLGAWSFDHQMMLNSFLQERFLMANLVKNANLEIEKIKSTSQRGEDEIRKYQSELGVLQGYIQKIRGSLDGNILSEQQMSIVGNIFADFDKYIQTSVMTGEPVRMLGDLNVTDQRIQSLLREKDAEILRLRDRIFSIEKSRVGSSSQSANQIIQVLRDENLKLKNEMAELRSQKGSEELVNSLKAELDQVQNRNLELEQQISDINADYLNLKRQFEVKLQIFGDEAGKASLVTRLDGGQSMRSPNMRSPVQEYSMTSPDYGTRMSDSQYRSGTAEQQRPSGGVTSRTQGMTDSSYSGAGQNAPSYQGGDSMGSSGIRGSGIRDGSNTGGYDSSYRGQTGSSATGGASSRVGGGSSGYQSTTGAGGYQSSTSPRYQGQSGTQSGYGQSSLSGSRTGQAGYGQSSLSGSRTGQSGYQGTTGATSATGSGFRTTGATSYGQGQTQGQSQGQSGSQSGQSGNLSGTSRYGGNTYQYGRGGNQ